LSQREGGRDEAASQGAREHHDTCPACGLFPLSQSQAESEEAQPVFGDEKRVKDSANHPADAHNRRMRERGSGTQEECENECSAESSAHTTPARYPTPITAITAPTTRTAIRPAGQCDSPPKAMPQRCSMPVAMTKPMEK